MAARSSLLRRAFRHASSVVAALAALAPRLVRLARHHYPEGLLAPAASAGGAEVALPARRRHGLHIRQTVVRHRLEEHGVGGALHAQAELVPRHGALGGGEDGGHGDLGLGVMDAVREDELQAPAARQVAHLDREPPVDRARHLGDDAPHLLPLLRHGLCDQLRASCGRLSTVALAPGVAAAIWNARADRARLPPSRGCRSRGTRHGCLRVGGPSEESPRGPYGAGAGTLGRPFMRYLSVASKPPALTEWAVQVSVRVAVSGRMLISGTFLSLRRSIDLPGRRTKPAVIVSCASVN